MTREELAEKIYCFKYNCPKEDFHRWHETSLIRQEYLLLADFILNNITAKVDEEEVAKLIYPFNAVTKSGKKRIEEAKESAKAISQLEPKLIWKDQESEITHINFVGSMVVKNWKDQELNPPTTLNNNKN